jgi:hypothetical protein
VDHDLVPVNLFDLSPTVGAGRLAILAWRLRLAHDAIYTSDKVILLPDTQPLSINQAAERLAGCCVPQLDEALWKV